MIHALWLLVLVLGATLVNVALKYGLAVEFGWWGWAFWTGIGLMLAWIKSAP